MDTYKEEREDPMEKPRLFNLEKVQQIARLTEVGNEKENEAYNSDEDPVQIVNFDHELKYIKELKGVDIIFVVDCTASMNKYMAAIKRILRKLLWDASKTLSQYMVDEEDLLQVGMVLYRDHPPQDSTFTTKVIQLTSDIVQFKQELQNISCKGGGDEAEAVLDALNDAVNTIKWRETSEKFIYHVLDSPPHGTEFSDVKDEFSNGCPCNLSYEEILIRMRELEVQYNIIKLDNVIDKMIGLFQERIQIDVMTLEVKEDPKKMMSQTA
jgi:hypothetical protein